MKHMHVSADLNIVVMQNFGKFQEQRKSNMVQWDKTYDLLDRKRKVLYVRYFNSASLVSNTLSLPPPPLSTHTRYNHHHLKEYTSTQIICQKLELLTKIQWTENWKPCSKTALTIHVSLSAHVWFHTQFKLASQDGQGLPDYIPIKEAFITISGIYPSLKLQNEFITSEFQRYYCCISYYGMKNS